MADWQKIRAEYITTDISYRKLADKYGLDQATIARRAKKEDWVSKRQHHADKTQAKILSADTKNKADRVGRLMTVADKLLDKVEKFVDASEYVSPTSAKNLSDTLKNIKEVCMVRTQEDIQEQKARIAKLQKEAQREDNQKEPIRVIIDEGLTEYSK